MAFFQSVVGTLQTLVAGLGIWGAINLMEGYGNDNPGAKSQGMKQLMGGGGGARTMKINWVNHDMPQLAKAR